MKDKIKENIEKETLELRGWKNWEEYDKIAENSKSDINFREEIINTAIEETSKAKDKEFLELLDIEQKDRINPNIIRAFCLKLKEKKNGNQ